MIKIHNFRAGFATNSSSSHSIILLPDDLVGKISTIEPDYDDSYGWDWFRLVTEEDKLRYLLAQLFSNFGKDRPTMDKIRARFAELGISTDWGEYEDTDDDTGVSRTALVGPSVDHQSVMHMPKRYDDDYVEGLIRMFRSPKVVVLGGNDNIRDDEDKTNVVPGAKDIELFHMLATDHDATRNTMKMRMEGNYIVAYNALNGHKARFTFGDETDYVKAEAPELIDIKLTDFCDKNCRFCYQSSTTAGLHAPLDRLETIFAQLGEMKVFEVALGGGEPTAHPDFARILRSIHGHGITPNFTTLSDAWLENDDIVEAVKETVGAIGVSCLNARGLGLVKAIESRVGWARYDRRVVAQHVVGSVPMEVTAEFINSAFEDGHAILLLGYKSVGFGATYARFDDPATTTTFLRMALSEAKWRPPVSIDTALLDLYPDLPVALGSPKVLVTSPEGKFSCYIDAVEGLMAESSYVEKASMSPLPSSTDGIKTLFATY